MAADGPVWAFGGPKNSGAVLSAAALVSVSVSAGFHQSGSYRSIEAPALLNNGVKSECYPALPAKQAQKNSGTQLEAKHSPTCADHIGCFWNEHFGLCPDRIFDLHQQAAIRVASRVVDAKHRQCAGSGARTAPATPRSAVIAARRLWPECRTAGSTYVGRNAFSLNVSAASLEDQIGSHSLGTLYSIM